MDPRKVYDYLLIARERLLDWTRPLRPEDYVREILPGQRNLARTLTHTMMAEWAYLRRIQRLPVPPYDTWPIREEEPPPFPTLEATWKEQAARARETLAAVRDWDVEFEYAYTDEDDGIPMIITAAPSDIFTQLAVHEVHHRGQAMMLLRALGVAVEDIDYNVLMYKRRAASPA